MNLTMTKQAHKACQSLDAKQYRQVVSAILGLLNNPTPHDSQPLRGASRGDRRLDAGEYRIIYVIEDETIEVLVVGKRNGDEVYKIWERM
jgi:mRNA interferase RelE/StbE